MPCISCSMRMHEVLLILSPYEWSLITEINDEIYAAFKEIIIKKINYPSIYTET